MSVANARGPETLRDLAAETGAAAVSVTDAARDKDLVIVTIPEENIPDLPDDLFVGTGDVVIVDRPTRAAARLVLRRCGH